MSRGSFDERADGRAVEPERPKDRSDALTRGLNLPKGERREPVTVGHREYLLRGSESRTLAAVGAFRVVAADRLEMARPAADIWRGDLRTLADQGLIERHRVVINDKCQAVVVLTRDGKALLDAHRSDTDGRAQQYHAGLVKPRELAHDAQIYQLYQAESERIESEGGHVTRAVLDFELKHDYQTFLNRKDKPEDADFDADLQSFSAQSGLPIVDGHLELPDLRIEYETEDGRLEHRDVELLTEHYSRGQLAGKAQSGFRLYRSGHGGHVGSGNSRHGGTPLDPHNLSWLS
jgi:hypothetical protein